MLKYISTLDLDYVSNVCTFPEGKQPRKKYRSHTHLDNNGNNSSSEGNQSGNIETERQEKELKLCLYEKAGIMQYVLWYGITHVILIDCAELVNSHNKQFDQCTYYGANWWQCTESYVIDNISI